MDKKPTKQNWEENKLLNENLILQNTIQIEMAREVIKLCEKKIKEFPKEKIKSKSLNADF